MNRYKKKYNWTRRKHNNLKDLLRKTHKHPTCFYCKKILNSTDKSIEHLVPLSIYPDIINNTFITYACQNCNRSVGLAQSIYDEYFQKISRDSVTINDLIGFKRRIVKLKENLPIYFVKIIEDDFNCIEELLLQKVYGEIVPPLLENAIR